METYSGSIVYDLVKEGDSYNWGTTAYEEYSRETRTSNFAIDSVGNLLKLNMERLEVINCRATTEEIMIEEEFAIEAESERYYYTDDNGKQVWVDKYYGMGSGYVYTYYVYLDDSFEEYRICYVGEGYGYYDYTYVDGTYMHVWQESEYYYDDRYYYIENGSVVWVDSYYYAEYNGRTYQYYLCLDSECTSTVEYESEYQVGRYKDAYDEDGNWYNEWITKDVMYIPSGEYEKVYTSCSTNVFYLLNITVRTTNPVEIWDDAIELYFTADGQPLVLGLQGNDIDLEDWYTVDGEYYKASIRAEVDEEAIEEIINNTIVKAKVAGMMIVFDDNEFSAAVEGAYNVMQSALKTDLLSAYRVEVEDEDED